MTKETPYIEAKKAEIVQGFEKFLSTDPKWQGSSKTISLLLAEYLELDTLLDEIESSVLPKKSAAWGMSRGEDRSDQDVRDDTIAQIEENFQHLRTGVTE